MSCLHRHLSAIPGDLYACSDDLGCRSVFTLTTDGEVETLRARVAQLHDFLARAMRIGAKFDTELAQALRERDAARDAARICEQALATRGSRLDGCGGKHRWKLFRDIDGSHTKCIACGKLQGEEGTS